MGRWPRLLSGTTEDVIESRLTTEGIGGLPNPVFCCALNANTTFFTFAMDSPYSCAVLLVFDVQ